MLSGSRGAGMGMGMRELLLRLAGRGGRGGPDADAASSEGELFEDSSGGLSVSCRVGSAAIVLISRELISPRESQRDQRHIQRSGLGVNHGLARKNLPSKK